jgi:hypothetical protein
MGWRNMFDFFKRLLAVPARQTTQPTKRRPKKRRQEAALDPTDPIPVPEVVEGNDHTDWDLWQDSVDSQVQPLSPSSRTYVDTTPSQLDDLDPFSRVRKRDR